jgi:hypothetical protein
VSEEAELKERYRVREDVGLRIESNLGGISRFGITLERWQGANCYRESVYATRDGGDISDKVNRIMGILHRHVPSYFKPERG